MRNYETQLHEYTETSTGKRVIKAVTKYAGKAVFAFAKCNPEDNFDIEFGTKLALKRLDLKIAKKRAASAARKAANCQRDLNCLKIETKRVTKLADSFKILAANRKVEINELETEIANMLSNI